VAIAITASMAALWFAFYRRTIVTTLAGGVVQGLAIASMHYTAMDATSFVSVDVPADLTTPLFAQDFLAFMIAGAIAVVCAGNLALLAFMSMQQKSLA
jgi:NO-binding membrane sensor protein with MHYT domain